MTHTAAIRSDISPGDTFNALGRRVARSIAIARTASFVPVDKALDSVQSTVDEHSVMFVYNRFSKTIDLSLGSDKSRDMLPQNFVMFDLMLTVTEGSDGLLIGATFNAKRFVASFMQRIADSYLTLLIRLVRPEAGQTLQSLLLSSAAELDRLETLAHWPISDQLMPKSLLHQAFEKRSVTHPSSIAIEFWSCGRRTTMSYSELNSQVRDPSLPGHIPAGSK